MKIRNQYWIETPDYIVITLHEPYWSAWKKFNWTCGVEGFGVSKEAIEYAISNKKRIRVHVDKYGTYEIGYEKVQKEILPERKFTSRDRKTIYVLPRTSFNKVVTFNKEEYEKKEEKRSGAYNLSLLNE